MAFFYDTSFIQPWLTILESKNKIEIKVEGENKKKEEGENKK